MHYLDEDDLEIMTKSVELKKTLSFDKSKPPKSKATVINISEFAEKMEKDPDLYEKFKRSKVALVMQVNPEPLSVMKMKQNCRPLLEKLKKLSGQERIHIKVRELFVCFIAFF